jgi:gluconolactonase
LGAREDFGDVLGVVIPGQRVADIRKMPAVDRATLGYPDNIAFDTAGNLWICLPFANRIVALTPSGKKIAITHDPEGRFLVMPTSLAWGGEDFKDLYIVSRGNGTVIQARTSVAGLPMANWLR